MRSPQIRVACSFCGTGPDQRRLCGTARPAVLSRRGPLHPPTCRLTAIAKSWVFEIELQGSKSQNSDEATNSSTVPLVFLLNTIGYLWTLALVLHLHGMYVPGFECAVELSARCTNVKASLLTCVSLGAFLSSIFQCHYFHSQSKPDESFHMLYINRKFLLLLISLSSLLPYFLKICFSKRIQSLGRYILLHNVIVCFCVCNCHSALYWAGNKSRCTF